MSAEIRYRKANRLEWKGSTSGFVAAVISSSLLWGSAQAADKEMVKGMPAMDMHQSMMNGMKDMETMKVTGDADYDFAMMMKKHHQSALDMANVELRLGKDPKIRSMAKGIIASQTKEIKEFDQWLAKHKNPLAGSMAK